MLRRSSSGWIAGFRPEEITRRGRAPFAARPRLSVSAALRVKCQLRVSVFGIFEQDQRLFITERLEAERRVAHRHTVGSFDQRMGVHIRYDRAPVSDDLTQHVVFLFRIERVRLDHDAGTSNTRQALEQEGHRRLIRAEPPCADDDVRVPVDLASI